MDERRERGGRRAGNHGETHRASRPGAPFDRDRHAGLAHATPEPHGAMAPDVGLIRLDRTLQASNRIGREAGTQDRSLCSSVQAVW